MSYIDENFSNLTNYIKIEDAYRSHFNKIVKLFIDYIDYLVGKQKCIALLIYVYKYNNNNEFYYSKDWNNTLHLLHTKFINMLLFDNIIPKLLEYKKQFVLSINNKEFYTVDNNDNDDINNLDLVLNAMDNKVPEKFVDLLASVFFPDNKK